MKASLSQILIEKFGMPLDSAYGTKVGDVKDISNVGAVGVRDMSEDIVVCPACGQMPPKVDASCSCGLAEAKSHCAQCGMNEATCECGMYESDDAVKSRSYGGDKYKSSAGSIAALKKHGGSKKKAVKAGAFDWAKDPWAAARAAEIVKTGRAKATRDPKAKD
ncbi:MAG: hypothetical protein FJZ60_02185 [Chlamydiae bacterium]|nr:hypothetical protein [Chlamydiota bacterium]